MSDPLTLAARIAAIGAEAAIGAIVSHAEAQATERARREVLDAALAAAEDKALRAIFPEDEPTKLEP